MIVTRPCKVTICSNCGEPGHHYKYCTAPITSFGIIAFRHKGVRDVQEKIRKENVEILLIQRKDSIGFVELLRAKYKVTDIEYIREQISGTTPYEREMLKTKPFLDLWTSLWGPINNYENRQYKQEFEQAKIKFEQLKSGVLVGTQQHTLESLIDTTPLLWSTPEWGFPKGRRNAFESDYSCAVREFCEETGLCPTQFHILSDAGPIRESFVGNNNIHYSHVYYLALINSDVEVIYQAENEHMRREIGDIQWLGYEEALQKIRNTNPEKKNTLIYACNILESFSLEEIKQAMSANFIRKEDECNNRNERGGNRNVITRSKSKPTYATKTRKSKSYSTSNEQYAFISDDEKK